MGDTEGRPLTLVITAEDKLDSFHFFRTSRKPQERGPEYVDLTRPLAIRVYPRVSRATLGFLLRSPFTMKPLGPTPPGDLRLLDFRHRSVV